MTKRAVLDSTVQKAEEWLKDVTEGLGFSNEKAAFAALRAVLHALRDRLPQQTAVDLGTQLPMLIRGMYYEGWDPRAEPTRARRQQEFFDVVAVELAAHRELRDARRVTRVVLGVLGNRLDVGEKEKVMLTLPQDLRDLFAVAPPKVRDIMSKEVAWVDPDISLQEAARKMRDRDIGCLPIGKDDRLIGMITDRDIACRAVADGDDPAKTPISAAMSKGISYCYDDQGIDEAARVMEEKQIHRLPVLNRQKRMIGMLSLGDLGLHAAHGLTGEVVEAIARHPAT
jgi:CBS domain-containing protein